MSIYQIETLTPIHIGSGEEFLPNYRYVYFPERKLVVLLNDQKVLKAFGGEEGIKHWIAALDQRQDLLQVLREGRNTHPEPQDLGSQFIPVSGIGPAFMEGKKADIRAQIRSADAVAIPGSSLKGAIRTAMLVLYIDEDKQDSFYRQQEHLTDRRGNLADAQLVKRHLGRDPNHDLFRLLQAGDTRFDKSICTLARTINLQSTSSWAFKQSIDQFIECIPAGHCSTIRLQFNQKLMNRSGNLFRKGKDLKPETLFHIINQHTQILIGNELAYWEDQKNYPDEVNTYVERLENIHTDLENLVEQRPGNQCMLRLGWGTGFRSMTGDWQEEKFSEKQYRKLAATVRRNRQRDHLPFPKTRKMTFEGEPFGFISLKKLSNSDSHPSESK